MSERSAWEKLDLAEGEHDMEEIHRAYRRKAKEMHPDAGGSRQDWDDLAEAYAMLVESQQNEASDQPENPGLVSRIVWGWRGWSRPSRVMATLAIGAAGGAALWEPLTPQGAPHGSSAALGVYYLGWWAWWVAREARRPEVRPQRWHVVMQDDGLISVQPIPEQRGKGKR